MGDKVDRDLCDERSGNIQKTLEEIKVELTRIWGKLNPGNNSMSTRKTVAVVTGVVVIVQTIAELIKGFL